MYWPKSFPYSSFLHRVTFTDLNPTVRLLVFVYIMNRQSSVAISHGIPDGYSSLFRQACDVQECFDASIRVVLELLLGILCNEVMRKIRTHIPIFSTSVSAMAGKVCWLVLPVTP